MSLPIATQKQREWAKRVVNGLCKQTCPHISEPKRMKDGCNWCLMSALTRARYGTIIR